MQKQNFSQGGFMPQNRQHHRKAKYPNKVAKPKSLAFVRIFLFRSAGSRNAYFPTAPFTLFISFIILFGIYQSVLFDIFQYLIKILCSHILCHRQVDIKVIAAVLCTGSGYFTFKVLDKRKHLLKK